MWKKHTDKIKQQLLYLVQKVQKSWGKQIEKENVKEDNGKQISCSPQLEEADKRWHVSAIQSNPTIILISVSSLILFHLCFVAHDLLFSLFSWQGFAIADIQSFPTMFISSLCFFLTDFCFRWQGLAISDIPRNPAIAKGTLNHKKTLKL